jgi:membrane protein
VREISSSSNQGLFSVSFIVALWAASGGMSATMNALDQIHQISPDHARSFWRAKLISLCLTLGTIVLLMTASFLVFVSDLLVALVIVHTPAEVRSQLFTTWLLLRWLLALGIVAIAFGFIYRFGPSRWTSGTPIMPGAMLAAVFWAILSGLFRFYVAQFGNYNRVYGAVGAVIVLLLWLYLTSLVLLLGDQLNFTVGERMRHDHQMRMLKGS